MIVQSTTNNGHYHRSLCSTRRTSTCIALYTLCITVLHRANCDHRREDLSISHRHVNGILFQMARKMGDIECCMIVSSSLQTKSHAIKVASDWQSFCIKFLCRLDWEAKIVFFSFSRTLSGKKFIGIYCAVRALVLLRGGEKKKCAKI